jgi:hypothetical protein
LGRYPLHLSDPPTDVPGKVKSKLHAFTDGSQFSTKALRGARKDQLDLSTPTRSSQWVSTTSPPALASTGRSRSAGATSSRTADNSSPAPKPR